MTTGGYAVSPTTPEVPQSLIRVSSARRTLREPEEGEIVFPILIATAALALPPFDPTNFVDRVDNPYLPLTPGSVYRYEGSKDGKRALDVVKITKAKKNIQGVNAT